MHLALVRLQNPLVLLQIDWRHTTTMSYQLVNKLVTVLVEWIINTFHQISSALVLDKVLLVVLPSDLFQAAAGHYQDDIGTDTNTNTSIGTSLQISIHHK